MMIFYFILGAAFLRNFLGTQVFPDEHIILFWGVDSLSMTIWGAAICIVGCLRLEVSHIYFAHADRLIKDIAQQLVNERSTQQVTEIRKNTLDEVSTALVSLGLGRNAETAAEDGLRIRDDDSKL